MAGDQRGADPASAEWLEGGGVEDAAVAVVVEGDRRRDTLPAISTPRTW
jgi:hypothetical protein